MDRSSVIKLIKETSSQNEFGEFIPVETSRNIYCNVRSVSGNEFFAAGTNGINASLVFSIFRYEYDREQILEFNGRRYSIYRVYENRGETLELYCEEQRGTR